jgi:hypothetical protein
MKQKLLGLFFLKSAYKFSRLKFFFLFTLTTNFAIAQNVATIKADNSVEVNPGVTNKISVTVTNTLIVALQDQQSKYTVTMEYKGSGTAGNVFNKEVELKDPIGPKKSQTFDITYTGPALPGEYDVDIYLKWGNKTVSNIIHSTFTVEGVYDVLLECETIALSVKRGKTEKLPLRFTITNTGKTTWPEGRYSLHYEEMSSPGGASTYDKNAFNISPKTTEDLELDPQNKETFYDNDFKPPFTSGNYVVRVSIYKDGKPFNAKGASIPFTFRVKVD